MRLAMLFIVSAVLTAVGCLRIEKSSSIASGSGGTKLILHNLQPKSSDASATTAVLNGTLRGTWTGTFGGGNEFFKAWGASDVAEATRLVDVCLEAGLTMFDSADVYSKGVAEEILGQAIKGRRDEVLISTKATFRRGDGPNDVGSCPISCARPTPRIPGPTPRPSSAWCSHVPAVTVWR